MKRILSIIGYLIMSLIGKTLRIREVNSLEGWKKYPHSGFVFAIWHGEQFIPFYHHRGQQVSIMSSLSEDGEIQTGILKLFGFLPVRGSSSKRAERSLVEMIINVKNGHSAAFAADGPKGPYRKVKPGVVFLAQKTNLPIIPVSSAAKRYKIFEKAWDKYELPMPFARAVITYGNPIKVGKSDNVEQKAVEVERELNKLSDFAHKNCWSSEIKEYLGNHPKPKILIIQPSRIGDVVFSLPTVAAIRKRYPDAWIGYFVDERCAPIVDGSKDLDEVIIFDRRKLSIGYLLGLYRFLHGKNIDVSIDLHGLFKSAIMVLLSGARFRIASSSTNGMRELSWLFSKEIKPVAEDSHCVERHLAVAKYLGCDTANSEFNISIPAAADKRVSELLSKGGVEAGKVLVVVHPGGGWFSRRWFPERYSALISKMISLLGAQVVLVGGKEGGALEKGLNGQIISNTNGKVLDLTDQLDLKELAALLKRSDIFIANEAGPMHIATGLNIKSVAILGPTDAKRTGPFGDNTIVIQHRVECQPCRERNCASKKCMELVTVEEVFEAVNRQLRKVR